MHHAEKDCGQQIQNIGLFMIIYLCLRKKKKNVKYSLGGNLENFSLWHCFGCCSFSKSLNSICCLKSKLAKIRYVSISPYLKMETLLKDNFYFLKLAGCLCMLRISMWRQSVFFYSSVVLSISFWQIIDIFTNMYSFYTFLRRILDILKVRIIGIKFFHDSMISSLPANHRQIKESDFYNRNFCIFWWQWQIWGTPSL